MSNRMLLLACCALAAGGICSSTLRAQPAAADGALRRAVEAAWQRSLQRPVAEGRLGVADAQRAASRSAWAAPPSLELSYRGDPLSSVSGQRESEVGLAWPLLLPGQQGARGASAQADHDAADAEQRVARLRVAGDVRETAWQALAAEAEVTLAEAHTDNLQKLAQDVARRVQAGDLARADALAVRAESLAAGAVLDDARQRLEAARARWRFLVGDASIPGSAEPPVVGAAGAHPELIVARLRGESARKRLDLVRATHRDPPELLVRYRRDVAAANAASQDSIGVAVRIPFGTADRNRPREAAALAEVDVSQADERRTRERLETDLATARAAAAAAERQLASEASRAALLRERAQLVERSFRAGETALPELLRAMGAAAQAEGEVARRRTEFGLARARAQQAAGLTP